MHLIPECVLIAYTSVIGMTLLLDVSMNEPQCDHSAEMLSIMCHVSGLTAKGMYMEVICGCIIFIVHAQITAAWTMLME